jgi:virginiamycin B lyase
LGFDSKGILWTSTLEAGIISRLDPATGEVKQYFPPGVPGIRGMAVDAHDNIWFSDFYNHRLGMLDQKTGTFKMYQPPTRGVGAYGIVVDPKTGYIWYGDQIGNYITRFDPATSSSPSIPFPLAARSLVSSISIRTVASGSASGGRAKLACSIPKAAPSR